MKKLMLSVLAVVTAVSFAVAGGPGLKFGGLTESGKLGATDAKAIHSLELVSPENGQSVASFTLEIVKAGKVTSRAKIVGGEIHEEMRVVMSRLKAGDRIVVKEVSIKNAAGATSQIKEVLQIDVF